MDIYCRANFFFLFTQSNCLEPERKLEWNNTKSQNYKIMNYSFNTDTILIVSAYEQLYV